MMVISKELAIPGINLPNIPSSASFCYSVNTAFKTTKAFLMATLVDVFSGKVFRSFANAVQCVDRFVVLSKIFTILSFPVQLFKMIRNGLAMRGATKANKVELGLEMADRARQANSSVAGFVWGLIAVKTVSAATVRFATCLTGVTAIFSLGMLAKYVRKCVLICRQIRDLTKVEDASGVKKVWDKTLNLKVEKRVLITKLVAAVAGAAAAVLYMIGTALLLALPWCPAGWAIAGAGGVLEFTADTLEFAADLPIKKILQRFCACTQALSLHHSCKHTIMPTAGKVVAVPI